MFEHIVVTRFNLKNFTGRDKRGSGTLTDEWHEHRFNLFERYCAPSMANQSNQNFHWLVLFDKTTSEKFRRRAEAAKAVAGANYTPLFTDVDSWPAAVAASLDSKPFLISTRFDNDDAFHRDAIAVIQSQFREQDRQFVNLVKGYRVQLPNKFYEVSAFMNHFTSLIVRRKRGCEIDSILHYDQCEIDKHGPIKNVFERPLWLELIHDRNIYNDWWPDRGGLGLKRACRSALGRLLPKSRFAPYWSRPVDGYSWREDFGIADNEI